MNNAKKNIVKISFYFDFLNYIILKCKLTAKQIEVKSIFFHRKKT